MWNTNNDTAPSNVRKLFLPVDSSYKLSRMACRFCNKSVADNGTRMKEHVLHCSKCPPLLKARYCPNVSDSKVRSRNESNQSSVGESSTSELTRATFTDRGESLTRRGGIDCFVDHMTNEERNEIDVVLARAIFGTGVALSFTENPLWQEAFRRLRPSYSPPSRHKLTTTLLEAEYMRVESIVKEKVNTAQSLALICDGWSNVRNESIISFVVSTPKPVFYKSIAPGSTSHTGEFIATSLLEVINEIGSEKFIGVVTDNAANMRNAWGRVQEVYPHLICYGCAAHGLQLLLGDICRLQSASQILENAKTIGKKVNKSHRLRALLTSHSKAVQCNQTIKLPVDTRWGSTIKCLESMLANKASLRRLAIDEDAQTLLGITRAIILDDLFWLKVVNLLELVRPILKWITIVEGDNPAIGIVVEAFAELRMHFIITLPDSPLTEIEQQQVWGIIDSRKEFCVNPVHKVANLLDPRYTGKHLTRTEAVDAIEFLCNMSPRYDLSQEDILKDLTNYRARQDFWNKDFVWKAVPKVTPVAWWTGMCTGSPLSTVAADILNLPATSAACERIFSVFGNIHTKKRNRLTNTTAAKLAFVSANLKFASEENVVMQDDEDVDMIDSHSDSDCIIDD